MPSQVPVNRPVKELGDPFMSCTPLPKAVKPAWAKQLTRRPCLEVYVKFGFVYVTKSKMGSQLLLASGGSEKAFNERQ